MRRSAVAFAVLIALRAAAQPAPRTEETITVERILVDTRVTTAAGDPITGLNTTDFVVRIDGRPATVESAEWVPDVAERGDEEHAQPGRLLIFLFQTDLAREQVRLIGQMKILPHAEKFIESLQPQDRVAVLSFDSHLEFLLDFSTDRQQIRQAMSDSLMTGTRERPQQQPWPSLGVGLDDDAMRRASRPEEALLLIAAALRPIQTTKSLILFGWGLGRMGQSGVHMEGLWTAARRALEESRTAVFSLDVTQADWHSLAVGLETAASETGGFYAATKDFPALALDRLQRTLSGHYELEIRRDPSKKHGPHTIAVAVRDHRGARIFAREGFAD